MVHFHWKIARILEAITQQHWTTITYKIPCGYEHRQTVGQREREISHIPRAFFSTKPGGWTPKTRCCKVSYKVVLFCIFFTVLGRTDFSKHDNSGCRRITHIKSPSWILMQLEGKAHAFILLLQQCNRAYRANGGLLATWVRFLMNFGQILSKVF